MTIYFNKGQIRKIFVWNFTFSLDTMIIYSKRVCFFLAKYIKRFLIRVLLSLAKFKKL